MNWLDSSDLERWKSGTHYDSYQKLGAHAVDGGTWFAVWAPHADALSVIGSFNGWDANAHPLRRVDENLWEGFVEGAAPGEAYKYRLRNGMYQVDKTDPYAFAMEPPAKHGHDTQGLASLIADLSFDWQDEDWMKRRQGPGSLSGPVSVYEVHLGSWLHKGHGESLSYREIAEPLADHVEELGFTHVELLPVAEHPYYGSWGYQVLGYYAPTHRFGSPQDFMALVNTLHQRGIGVLLDWVPAHFATDPQGLVFFDGSTLFEYDDPVMRTHPDWRTYVFDYNKPGVQNFLISNALFWLDHYHIDGLRVDAVASMLYRDYSRDHWTPNIYGGRENLEAIELLKRTNEQAFSRFGEVMMIAEESTSWPGVSAPTYDGGLGFLYKWNMGWMHDTLEYVTKDPIHRQYHHNDLTFPLVYAHSEHYVLPFSHDEVVHGKGSLWTKMPGDAWQQAANLRLTYAHMIGHPGKKLLFMGSEYGQVAEWNHDHSIEWHLRDVPRHAGVFAWTKALLHLYRQHPALWNDEPGGFTWIDHNDAQNSVASYVRQSGDHTLVFVLNFTPVVRTDYRIGMPAAGTYREVLNSDAEVYHGSGIHNAAPLNTQPIQHHGREHSLALTLPPLGALILERTEEG